MTYLEALRSELGQSGLTVAKENILVTSGRVRAGYRAGDLLFGPSSDGAKPRAVVHIIGERPGSGHHCFSAYLAAPKGEKWAKAGTVDHDIAKMISNISNTTLDPKVAARQTVDLLKQMMQI